MVNLLIYFLMLNKSRRNMPLSCFVMKLGRDILMCPLDNQPDSLKPLHVLLLQQGLLIFDNQNCVDLHSHRIGNVIESLGLDKRETFIPTPNHIKQ